MCPEGLELFGSYSRGDQTVLQRAAHLPPRQKTGFRIAGNKPHTGPSPENLDAIYQHYFAENNQKYRGSCTNYNNTVGTACQMMYQKHSSDAKRQSYGDRKEKRY